MRALLMVALPFSIAACSRAPESNKAVRTEPALAAPIARQIPHEILGIPLGAPVSAVAECKKGRDGFALDAYEQPKKPCIAYSKGTPEENAFGFRSSLYFNFADIPSGVKDEADAIIVNGRIAGLDLRTEGHDVQASLYALLVEKLGEPSTTNVDKAQNAMGASFDDISASWADDEVSYTFRGILGRVDSGSIWARTEEGRAFDTRLAARNKRSF